MKNSKKGFTLIVILFVVLILFACIFGFYNWYFSKGTKQSLNAKPKVEEVNKGSYRGIMLKRLTYMIKQQKAFFAKNGRYATDLKELNLKAGIPSLKTYSFGISDNQEGWVAWARHNIKDKEGKGRFYVGMNIKTGKACCGNIDKDACKMLNMQQEPSCPSQGFKEPLKNFHEVSSDKSDDMTSNVNK